MTSPFVQGSEQVTNANFFLHRAWATAKNAHLQNIVDGIQRDKYFNAEKLPHEPPSIDDAPSIKKVELSMDPGLLFPTDHRGNLRYCPPEDFLAAVETLKITFHDGNDEVLYALVMGIWALWQEGDKTRWGQYDLLLRELQAAPLSPKDEHDQKTKLLVAAAGEIAKREPRIMNTNWATMI